MADVSDVLSLPDLTTPAGGYEMLKEATTNASVGKKDKLAGKDRFNAIVLFRVNPPDNPFTANQVSAMIGTQLGEGTEPKYYGYRMRITDDTSPHAFYPIPCSMEEKPTQANKKIGGMHTMIITEVADLAPGDQCIVRLNKHGEKYDLSYGFYVDYTGTDKEYFGRVHSKTASGRETCEQLGELVDISLAGFIGGTPIDPDMYNTQDNVGYPAQPGFVTTSGFSSYREVIHDDKGNKVSGGRAHKGQDYVAAGGTGAPILALADGTYSAAVNPGGWGNYVRIKHSGKSLTKSVESLYAHLDKYVPTLKDGANVRKGDIIGYQGSTGASTGPHLHLEVKVNGTHVDPRVYIQHNLNGRNSGGKS